MILAIIIIAFFVADCLCWTKSDYPATPEWIAYGLLPGSGFVALFVYGFRDDED